MTTSSSKPHTPHQPPSASSAAVQSEVEKAKTIKELAASHTDLALKRLTDILKKGESGADNDKPASDMAVIMAANSLLDRGHGKPTQYLEQTTKIETLGDLLTIISQKEKAYQEVITVEVKPVELLPKILGWEDVL